MSKALLVATAVSLALSSTAFAAGTQSKRSSAADTTASQITQQDCQILSVRSARASCMRYVARSSGGTDTAAVGMSSDASASGAVSGGNATMNGSNSR